MVGHQSGCRFRILDDPRHRLAVQRGGHPVRLDVEEKVPPIQRTQDAVGFDGPQLIFA
jgi:hypothetical protein